VRLGVRRERIPIGGGGDDPTYDTRQAIAVLLVKHAIACDRMHGFNQDDSPRAG